MSNAVSPTVTQIADAKAKTLTVLAGAPSSAIQHGTTTARDSAAADLSEQRNAEVKKSYVKGKQIGSGTYADVFLGHVRGKPEQHVAIKKIKIQTEFKAGLAMDAIREVKFLQELSHPNIIRLHDIFTSKNQNISLVLEYLPGGDLEQLIHNKDLRYGLGDMKAWMGMICRAVWWLHESYVLHRDIKPNNLFIAANGEIKLADFGLARSFAEPYIRMTTLVITRWYRPLELFFGAPHYSGAVDIWSVGCTFAEISIRTPFMSADSDAGQVKRIVEALGAPTERNWPGVTKLPLYMQMTDQDDNKAQATVNWSQLFANIGPDGQDLLKAMLQYDPRKRISAKAALQHKWFSSGQKPTKTQDLPRKGGGRVAMANDLKQPALDRMNPRLDNVARKIDFGAAT